MAPNSGCGGVIRHLALFVVNSTSSSHVDIVSRLKAFHRQSWLCGCAFAASAHLTVRFLVPYLTAANYSHACAVWRAVRQQALSKGRTPDKILTERQNRTITSELESIKSSLPQLAGGGTADVPSKSAQDKPSPSIVDRDAMHSKTADQHPNSAQETAAPNSVGRNAMHSKAVGVNHNAAKETSAPDSVGRDAMHSKPADQHPTSAQKQIAARVAKHHPHSKAADGSAVKPQASERQVSPSQTVSQAKPAKQQDSAPAVKSGDAQAARQQAATAAAQSGHAKRPAQQDVANAETALAMHTAQQSAVSKENGGIKWRQPTLSPVEQKQARRKTAVKSRPSMPIRPTASDLAQPNRRSDSLVEAQGASSASQQTPKATTPDPQGASSGPKQPPQFDPLQLHRSSSAFKTQPNAKAVASLGRTDSSSLLDSRNDEPATASPNASGAKKRKADHAKLPSRLSGQGSEVDPAKTPRGSQQPMANPLDPARGPQSHAATDKRAKQSSSLPGQSSAVRPASSDKAAAASDKVQGASPVDVNLVKHAAGLLAKAASSSPDSSAVSAAAAGGSGSKTSQATRTSSTAKQGQPPQASHGDANAAELVSPVESQPARRVSREWRHSNPRPVQRQSPASAADDDEEVIDLTKA